MFRLGLGHFELLFLIEMFDEPWDVVFQLQEFFRERTFWFVQIILFPSFFELEVWLDSIGMDGQISSSAGSAFSLYAPVEGELFSHLSNVVFGVSRRRARASSHIRLFGRDTRTCRHGFPSRPERYHIDKV
jgi:hypothetical protein